MKYGDIRNRLSVANRLVFYYVLNSDPTDTLEEEVSVSLGRESAVGGDIVGPVTSRLKDVRTYAIHLTNSNNAGAAIGRMLLSTSGDVKIMAVGPTASDTQAALRFGSDGVGAL